MSKSINNGLLISKVSPFFLYLFFCLVMIGGCNFDGKSSGVDTESYDQAVQYYKEKEYSAAFKIFLVLSEEGNPFAQSFLGGMYYNGLGTSVSYEKAAYWYDVSAKSGISVSETALAEMYLYGLGVDKDCNKSIGLYNRALEKCNTRAMYSLAYLYSRGLCVDIDHKKENEIIAICSNSDDEYGLICRALSFYEGVGCDVDYAKSLKLFLLIAKKYDSSVAYLYLYRMYFYGLGVKKNTSLAFEHLNKASEFGSISADYALAVTYFKGDHVRRDYGKVFDYAMKSATKHSGSAYILGVLYEQGFGVHVDLQKAKNWYRKAVSMGNEKAKKRLELLQ